LNRALPASIAGGDMTRRSQQHAAYTLAVIENHHARHASQPRGAGERGPGDLGPAIFPLKNDNLSRGPEKLVPSIAADWEAARRQRANERGYAYVPPAERTDRGQGSDTDCTIAADNELARIAMALKLTVLFRLWLILHQLARLTKRQGFTQDELVQKMHELNVKHEDSNLIRNIHRGHRLFWELDGNTGMIYPAGYVSLALRLVKRAYAFDFWDIFITNIAGRSKDMYLDVSGSAADFESTILAGWHASKNNPTISRFVLTHLFNRDVRTMRKLEKRAGIKTVHNVAHTYDPSLVPLDDDGNLRWDVETYQDRAGRTVYAFTMSNTYHAPRVRQHHRWGQNRRARAVINNLMEKFELPSSRRGTGQPGKLNTDRTRQYFETGKSARGSFKKFGDQPRHIPLGADDGNTVHWELSLDGQSGMDFWEASDGISHITPLYRASYNSIQSEPF
jgi:hypothetical protein